MGKMHKAEFGPQIENLKAHAHEWKWPSLKSDQKQPHDPIQAPKTSLFTYNNKSLSPNEASLSMRFMHKPSRASEELQRASDTTKKNSKLNEYISPDSSPKSGPGSPLNDHLIDADAAPHKLVRKKSGEIVKSLLKDPSTTKARGVRSRSLPSTPTYKQVHFGGDNDVRYFKQKDKPAAILAQNSPTSQDDYEEEEGIPSIDYDSVDDEPGALEYASLSGEGSYFDYFDDELNSHADKVKARHNGRVSPPGAAWNLRLLNFPSRSLLECVISQQRPVFLENMFLSVDKKYLLGQVAVSNMSFEKSVNVRYTLDNWSTVVEILAVYIPDSPSILRNNNYDRFMFKISLDLFLNGFHPTQNSQSSSAEELSSELCIKYSVPGMETWDNNDGKNYQFTLSRKSPSTSPKFAQMPNTARTKQETHTRKPKYSLSYLKRINSEPSISTDSKSTFDADAISHAGHNDFEKNNFYLSSPLLSNFISKDSERTFFESTDHRFIHESLSHGRSPSPGPITRANSSGFEDGAAWRSFLPEPSDRAPKKLHETMTYKELLDSYCFFSSDKKANPTLETTNNNESDSIRLPDVDPRGSYDARTQGVVDNSGESIFTVSSFLK